MSSFKNEKSSTGKLGISENIHIEGVNNLQVITKSGLINVDKFVCDSLKHHQELIAIFDPLIANDYLELDYNLHRALIAKEINALASRGER